MDRDDIINEFKNEQGYLLKSEDDYVRGAEDVWEYLSSILTWKNSYIEQLEQEIDNLEAETND